MKNLHFLLRYSDKLANADTLTEHENVLKQNGAVWIGKFGLGMSKTFTELALNQIHNNQKCSLYLMHGSEITSKANIIGISSSNTVKGKIWSPEPNLTPSYYRNQACSVWFKLNSFQSFHKEENKKLWLYNNPGSHPSSSGMRGLIYLTYGDPITDKKKRSKLDKPSIYTEGLFD